MAEKKYFKDLSRRDYIVKANEIVRAEGAEALTIRRIAREMHCSSACLYHYFENLEELLFYAQIGFLNYYLEEIQRAQDETAAAVNLLTLRGSPGFSGVRLAALVQQGDGGILIDGLPPLHGGVDLGGHLGRRLLHLCLGLGPAGLCHSLLGLRRGGGSRLDRLGRGAGRLSSQRGLLGFFSGGLDGFCRRRFFRRG